MNVYMTILFVVSSVEKLAQVRTLGFAVGGGRAVHDLPPGTVGQPRSNQASASAGITHACRPPRPGRMEALSTPTRAARDAVPCLKLKCRSHRQAGTGLGIPVS